MGQAVGDDRGQFFGQIPGERIAHLDRGRKIAGAVSQHFRQVLTAVPSAAEEQGDAVSCRRGDDPRSERSSSLIRGAIFTGLDLFLGVDEFQDFHGCVVIVQHLPLSCLADQFVRSRRRIAAWADTISHCVEAGRGTPRLFCSLS